MTNPQKPGFFAWQKEKEILDRMRKETPALFEKSPMIDDAETLAKIGIHPGILDQRPVGHIKLYPEDFIVEEVTKDEVLHTIENGPLFADNSMQGLEQKTVWLDVVKIGIDTIEVVDEIAKIFGIEKKCIGFAGIKDKHAITAQSLSIRGKIGEHTAELKAPNFFIKNIRFGKGALQTGDLKGNRFTLFIRTKDIINDQEFGEKIKDLEEQGFWNFFYLQRFGAPRMISHLLGFSILRGNYEEAVRADIVVSGSREVPYFQEIRKKLGEQWGDWNAMLDTVDEFPYSFREEIKMLTFLRERPEDFAGALNQIPEQVRLWVYAYSSFCFNELLSRFIREAEDIPLHLPLILSGSPQARELYHVFEEAHGIEFPFRALKPFPYVQRPQKDIDTLQKITVYHTKVLSGGVIIDFLLGKGSYATTFLSHLFELSSGLPLPEGISAEEIDTKAAIGTGSISHLREDKFKELFAMREKDADEE